MCNSFSHKEWLPLTLPAGWYPGSLGWGFQHCDAFSHEAEAALTSACRTTAFDLCLQDRHRSLSVLTILHYALLIVGCHIALALTPGQPAETVHPFWPGDGCAGF